MKSQKENVQKKFTCNKCGKSLSSNSTLKRHLRAHKDIKDVTSHKKNVHEGEKELMENQKENVHKKFTCDKCGKNWPSNSRLKRHLKSHKVMKDVTSHNKNVHEGEKIPKISYCIIPLTQSSQFKSKLRSKNSLFQKFHEGLNRVTCDLCSKSFASNRNLFQHKQNAHNCPKTYTCKLCNEIFCTNKDLTHHKNTVHEGINNYNCEFNHEIEYQLKKFSIHLNRIAFQMCDICKKYFNDPIALKHHINNTHKNESEKDIPKQANFTKNSNALNINDHIETVKDIPETNTEIVDEDEDCSAKPKCQRPFGLLDWVQCDQCQLWFHLKCIGIEHDESLCDEDFICKYCKYACI